jgi:PAS domain S-box-containing protein
MTSIAQEVRGRHDWQLGNQLRMPIVVAVAYYLGAEAAFFIGTLSDKIFAPFWPPNIVLFCALLLSPRRQWWWFILAALPAHIAAEITVGMNASAIIVAFITNCLVSAMSASFVQLLIGRSNWFSSPRKAAFYILLTVVLSPAIAALGGAFVQVLNGGGLSAYSYFWARWYASNALGAATLGPFAMVLLDEQKRRVPWDFTLRHIEVVLLAIALIATSMLAFSVTPTFLPTGYLPTLLYLPLPLIVWAAVRFGVAGASGSVLIVGSVLLWRTLNGNSLFNIGDAEANVFAAQIFLIGLSVPVILLGSAIEETQRAGRMTHESEERMAFAAASSNIGLWIYTFDTGTFWATEHSRKMFGLMPKVPMGLDEMLARVHPGELEVTSTIRSSIHRRVAFDFEFRIQEKDGKIRWISVRALPHRDVDGNIIEMTGTFVDVTARKTAQEEALMRQQEVIHLMRVSMLGELSGGLAHELTQPLTAILSNAQAGRMLLALSSPDLEEIASILDDIITEDGRAGEVIHRLRGLLKKGEIRNEAVDINGLIESTLHLLHSEIISRRATVSTNLVSGLPLARGDPVQLQQILLNLLLNAIDAMEELSPSRRIISVNSCLTDKLEIEVSIRDRGTGLPMTEKEDVFKPFFTTKKRGLGIGLSICSSIIKSHGGTLTLENNAGEGATATFRLPSQTM